MTSLPPTGPQFTSQPPTPKPRSRLVLVAGAVGALAVAGGIGGAVGAGMTQARMASGGSSAISLPGTAGNAPSSFADVAERVKPAVVSVHGRVRRDPRAEAFGDFFRRFGPAQQPEEVAGSGFFVSSDGFIVTNNHVIENSDQLKVSLDDGRMLDARLIGRDPRTDLALLKVEGGPFPFARFAQHEPRIGDWVLAVGNPFGLGGTVTSGIVSARGRDIGSGPYDDFLQIDAPVNQGNSGGPTFNLAGEVVGVNTAIYSPSGGNVGIAFAIPASSAQPVIEALQRDGSVTRGYLGVAAQPLTEELARSMGLRLRQGALVAQVTPGSPAARAGIRPGDIITSVNNHDIADARALARVVGAVRPGTQTAIEFQRGGQERTARIELSAQPAQMVEASQQQPGSKPGFDGGPDVAENEALGLAVTARAAGGVTVVGVDPSGAAATRGIDQGDVILEAGGRAVTAPGDLDTAVTEARRVGRGMILLRVQSRDGVGFVAVPIARG
jgi:serine protease Do